MNSNKRTARLGVLVAGSAALLAFGMSAPAQAMPGNGGGANVSGVYSPAADSSSKGPADLKNPPGQVGNEHSNGYECNGNNGVGTGKTPAHSNNCPNDDGDTSVVVDPGSENVS